MSTGGVDFGDERLVVGGIAGEEYDGVFGGEFASCWGGGEVLALLGEDESGERVIRVVN